MTSKNKLWRILPLILFGGWYAYKLSRSFEDDVHFNGLAFLFIGAIGLSAFAWIIHVDIDEYRADNTITSFMPTFTGILLIIFIVAMYSFQYRRIHAPSLLKAFYDGGYNSVSLDLKEDGTYVLSNGNYGGQAYIYGNYTIKDSLISLDKDNLGNFIQARNMVIRSVTNISSQNNVEGLDTSYANYIFLKDQDNKIADKDFFFRVIEDHRKK